MPVWLDHYPQASRAVNIFLGQRRRLVIDVPYSDDIVSRARALPDREFDKKARVWWVPADKFHADAVLRLFGDLGLEIDPDVISMAAGLTPPVKMKHVDGLYEFQIEDAEFIERREGVAFLGHDPGVGKTPIVLDYLANHPECERVLVVVPTVGVYNWNRLAMQWIGEPVHPVTKVDAEWPDERIVACSYTMARLRADELIKKKWDLLILDECHRVKDSKALQSKAIRKMGKQSAKRILMSGKPFLNKVTELWHPLHVLDPVGWPDWWRFATRYTLGRDAYWTGLVNGDELKRRLAEVMVRRTKREVLTWLPALTRQVIPIDPAEDFMSRYLARENELVTSGTNPLAALTELRQMAGLEAMLVAKDMAKNFMEESEEKLVLYCHHLEVMAYLVHELEQYGVDFINGSIPASERLVKAQRFQNEPRPRIMIINSAASEAIDLYRSADIYFVEREWTPAIEEQAEGRLDRSGQTMPVTSSYITLTGTVMERLAGVVEGKRHEFGRVLKSDDVQTAIMTEVWNATRAAVEWRLAKSGA
jgi:SNF2 family DNA or RNA helicase